MGSLFFSTTKVIIDLLYKKQTILKQVSWAMKSSYFGFLCIRAWKWDSRFSGKEAFRLEENINLTSRYHSQTSNLKQKNFWLKNFILIYVRLSSSQDKCMLRCISPSLSVPDTTKTFLREKKLLSIAYQCKFVWIGPKS